MTGCADKTMLLHALVDGELDAANSIAIEAHIKTCPECAAALREVEAIRAYIAQTEIRYPAPHGLKDGILAAIDAPIANNKMAARRTPASGAWFAGGAMMALAASLLLFFSVPRLAATSIEDQVIANHVRSLLANHLTDVATSDRHVVKPWFNGKIDFAPPVIELADQGFPLVGGRLDVLDGRVVAALVYHRRLHSINVFVRPARNLIAPGEIATRRNGYSVVHWGRAGLECWAVSDIDLDELKLFRRDFENRLT